MDFQKIVSISQGPLSIMNPLSMDKALYIGEAAGMTEGETVIDFGCGNGTLLGLWGQNYGIGGTGIDIREDACHTATVTIDELGLSDRIKIFFADASVYEKEENEFYDYASAFGASQIWGGIDKAIEALAGYISEGGKIIIGDRFWQKDSVLPEFSRQWPEILTEYEIMQIIHDCGFELETVIHSSRDEWDSYESGIWHNCLDWARSAAASGNEEEAGEIMEYYRRIQEEYIAYGREYLGWGLYILG